jgi:hypothetical protein
MLFLIIRLKLKLFLSFFQPLDLFPLRLSTGSRPSALFPPGLVFGAIFAIPILDIRGYCKLEIRRVAVVFLRDLLVSPFFECL